MFDIPETLDPYFIELFLFELTSTYTVALSITSIQVFQNEPDTDPAPYLKFLESRKFIRTGEVRVHGKDYPFYEITDFGFQLLGRLQKRFQL